MEFFIVVNILQGIFIVANILWGLLLQIYCGGFSVANILRSFSLLQTLWGVYCCKHCGGFIVANILWGIIVANIAVGSLLHILWGFIVAYITGVHCCIYYGGSLLHILWGFIVAYITGVHCCKVSFQFRINIRCITILDEDHAHLFLIDSLL